MPQFPRYNVVPTPGGLNPSPHQVRVLDLSKAIEAVKPDRTAAGKTGTSSGKSKGDDFELKGRIGAVNQWQEMMNQISADKENLMMMYGPVVATTMPAMRDLNKKLEYMTSPGTLNIIDRETRETDEYRKLVNEKKAGGLYNLEEFINNGMNASSLRTNSEWIDMLEQSKTDRFASATGRYDNEESDMYRKDFAKAPNFYNIDDARKSVLELYSSHGKYDGATANVTEGVVGAAIGIMKKSSSWHDDIEQITAAEKRAKEHAMNLDVSEPIASGYLQAFLQREKTSGRLEEYYGKNGYFTKEGQKSFFENFQKFVEKDIEEQTKTVHDKGSTYDESFDQYNEYYAKGAGIEEEVAAWEAATTAQAEGAVIEEGVGYQNDDIGYSMANSMTTQQVINFMQEAYNLGMFEGVPFTKHLELAEKIGKLSNTGMHKKELLKDPLLRTIYMNGVKAMNDRMVDDGTLMKSKVDGKTVYSRNPMSGDEEYEKHVADKKAELEKIANDPNASQEDRNRSMMAASAYAIIDDNIKNEKVRNGVKATTGITYTAHQIGDMGSFDEYIASVLVGRDGKETGHVFMHTPITFDGGMTWIDGAALAGQDYTVVDVKRGAKMLLSPGAANFRLSSDGSGNFYSNTDPNKKDNPSYQSSAERGWLLPAINKEEYNARLNIAMNETNNTEAIYATPIETAKVVTLRFKSTGDLTKSLKGVKQRVQLSYTVADREQMIKDGKFDEAQRIYNRYAETRNISTKNHDPTPIVESLKKAGVNLSKEEIQALDVAYRSGNKSEGIGIIGAALGSRDSKRTDKDRQWTGEGKVRRKTIYTEIPVVNEDGELDEQFKQASNFRAVKEGTGSTAKTYYHVDLQASVKQQQTAMAAKNGNSAKVTTQVRNFYTGALGTTSLEGGPSAPVDGKNIKGQGQASINYRQFAQPK